MKITRQTQIVFLFSVLLFFATTGLVFGTLYFTEVAKDNLEKKKIEITRVRTQEQEMLSLARLVDESKDERKQLSSYVLHEDDIIDFLALLGNLADEQGLTLDISDLNYVETDEGFEELRSGVSVTGSKDSVLYMLELLESLPYQTTIYSASVVRDGDQLRSVWAGDFVLGVTKQKEL